MSAPPEALITGTGRSGSGYIARALSDCGVLCGHEEWWNPQTHRRDGLVADSSWPALALNLGDWDGQIFHQVRHPIRVISSMMQEVGRAKRIHPYWQLRTKMFTPTGDQIPDAVACYLAFFDRAEELSSWTWRLEDVDAGLLCEIGDRLGHPIAWDVAERVVEHLPKDMNHHGVLFQLELDDLPVKWIPRIEQIAARYDYDLESGDDGLE